MKLRTLLLVALLLGPPSARLNLQPFRTRPRWRVHRLRVELEDLAAARGMLPARLLH